jgi:hypothetical protein
MSPGFVAEAETLKRPSHVTNYRWRKYLRAFQNGCQFWTSEDGYGCDLVVLPVPSALLILQTNFSHLKIAWATATLRERWVHQEWVGSEFFDGPYSRGRGKLWCFSSEPTAFAVLSLDPG